MSKFRVCPALALLLLCTLSLLAGCPKRTTDGGSAGQGSGLPSYPDDALSYLKESLLKPADDTHPPLAESWDVVARLEQIGEDPELRKSIADFIDENRQEPPYQLVGAWLVTDPAAAEAFLSERLAAGDAGMVGALTASPARAKEILGGLQLGEASEQLGLRIINLKRAWPSDQQLPVEVLQQLSGHASDEVALQAIGLLIAQGEASAEQRDRLITALASGELRSIAAAAEGAHFSKDAALADELVPLVANTPLSGGAEAAAGNDQQMRQRYGSYALAWLPGAQAEQMRVKLISARDPLIAWHARLGQAINGDPEAWLTALLNKDIDDSSMWTALEAPEAVAPDILITYEMASASGEMRVRGRSAVHLARYAGIADPAQANEILANLVADTEPEVAAAAWRSAALFADASLEPVAHEVIADESAAPTKRMAAAYYLLRQAERRNMD